MKQNNFFQQFIYICFLCIVLCFCFLPSSAQAHSDDLSVAQFFVNNNQTKINLAFPSSVLYFADDNLDNQISVTEINNHQSSLEEFISNNLILTNNDVKGKLTIKPSTKNSLPYIIKDRSYSHSQIVLEYNWIELIKNLTIDYRLFPEGISTAHCIASIFHNQQTENYIFSRNNRKFILNTDTKSSFISKNLLITLAIALIWGSLHALSPGHGKSMVIAYLVISRATTKHAIFLGLMTTATHTLGIFILGIITLLLSKYILPEQLYPFLSLTSGLGIIIVAGYLFKKRILDSFKKDTLDHHHHDHEHDHSHHHHDLSITDTEAEIEWSSLITLGISSGLIPCPAALILLLGTITVGNISLGILLVLMFSLGLAVTLITIGILSIKAKTFFSKIPSQINLTQKLAMIAPIFIFIVGLIITYKALNQLPLII